MTVFNIIDLILREQDFFTLGTFLLTDPVYFLRLAIMKLDNGQVYNADPADLFEKHDFQVREMWSAF